LHADVFLAAERGIHQRQALLNAQIGASPTTAPLEAKAAGEHLAEEVLHLREHVSDAALTAASAAFEPGVPELIVDLALLVIREDLVGLVDLFEIRLRLRIPLIPIRMVAQSLAFVGLA
jgi:hypothetical protein